MPTPADACPQQFGGSYACPVRLQPPGSVSKYHASMVRRSSQLTGRDRTLRTARSESLPAIADNSSQVSGTSAMPPCSICALRSSSLVDEPALEPAATAS